MSKLIRFVWLIIIQASVIIIGYLIWNIDSKERNIFIDAFIIIALVGIQYWIIENFVKLIRKNR